MNEKTVEVFIYPNGECLFIHADDLAQALETMGIRHDQRASHVEPDPANPGMWLADLSPINGQPLVLGPFKLRREALEAEVSWLSTHLSM